jgi:hypothetical protein
VVLRAFDPKFMKIGVLTAALQEHDVLPSQEIPTQGTGREPYRS